MLKRAKTLTSPTRWISGHTAVSRSGLAGTYKDLLSVSTFSRVNELSGTVKSVPYPERIIRLANSWGEKSRSKQFGNKLEFLDRRYDWDNDEIDEKEALVEPPSTAAHPGILAEIPGVELESDHDDGTTSAIEAVPRPDLATRAATARENANLAQNQECQYGKLEDW